jgi:hypothetical protein
MNRWFHIGYRWWINMQHGSIRDMFYTITACPKGDIKKIRIMSVFMVSQ